jgi:hypothetical protein
MRRFARVDRALIYSTLFIITLAIVLALLLIFWRQADAPV